MTLREADFPYGRELRFCGKPWLVVATQLVEGGTGPCPFMVLIRQPGRDPHPCDWIPVTSLVREAEL